MISYMKQVSFFFKIKESLVVASVFVSFEKWILKVLSALFDPMAFIFLSLFSWDINFLFYLRGTFVFHYFNSHEMLAFWNYWFFFSSVKRNSVASVLLFINYLLQVTVICRTVDGVLAFLIGLCRANLFTTGQRNMRYLRSFPVD